MALTALAWMARALAILVLFGCISALGVFTAEAYAMQHRAPLWSVVRAR
jgi:hypothetical protein